MRNKNPLFEIDELLEVFDEGVDLLLVAEGKRGHEAHERLHDRHVSAHVRRVNTLQQRQQLHAIPAHRREFLMGAEEEGGGDEA